MFPPLKTRKESSHHHPFFAQARISIEISIEELCKVNVDRRRFSGDPLIGIQALVGATGHFRQQQLLQSPDWVDLCM
jgi:hypothetical protein